MRFLFITSIFYVFSCSENETKKTPILSSFERLELYCNSKRKSISNYKRVIVINEIGTCINCNNIFAKNQGENLNADSTLFIVSGIGNKVDLSSYIDRESPNLIFDEASGFDSLNIVKSCAIITLKKDSIQSIELINVNNVHELSTRKF